jgi:tetratricopeptide (TPR) repeat protein
MGNNTQSLFVAANYEYQSGNIRKARMLFRQAFMIDSQSVQVKAGLIICLTRFLEFTEAEELLNGVDDSMLTNLDELTQFRIIYSKVRVLNSKKKIQEGLFFIDKWIPKIDPMYLPILLLEKAAFLVLEKKHSEALDLIMKSNEALKPELRAQTIGRITYILLDMKERSLALRFLLEDFRLRPSIPTIIAVIFYGIICNPFFISIIITVWWIIWFLIPITTLSGIILALLVLAFGIIPIIAFPKNEKTIRNYFILVWSITIFMYLLKTFHIYLQIGVFIGFIVALIMELVLYKSLFRYEGKGQTTH